MSVQAVRPSSAKERHRRAIVAAAADLIHRRGTLQFSVDELAAAADVSRRTIFNHFASLEEVIGQVCADELDEVGLRLEEQVLAGTGDRPVDDLVAALRAIDLLHSVRRLHGVIGLAPDDDWNTRLTPQQENLLLRTFMRVGARLDAVLRDRHPQADPVQVGLLLGATIGGLVVLHRHWLTRTGGRDDAAARSLWHRRLDEFLQTLLHGHHGSPCAPAPLT